MSEPSKIYLGAPMPSHTKIKKDIEQKYPCTETKTEFGSFGQMYRTKLFKQNYVEVNNKESNMAFIREKWNGKDFVPVDIHSRSSYGSFDHFSEGKNGKFGIFKENGIDIVYEDKNNNGKFDTEEAWYYNEQGQKKYLF